MDNVVFIKDRRAEQLARYMGEYLEGEDLDVAMTALAMLCKGLSEAVIDLGALLPTDHEEFNSDLIKLICEHVLG